MNNLNSYGFGWRNIIILLAIVFLISLLIPSNGGGFNIFGKGGEVALIKIEGEISNSEGSFLQKKVTPEKIRSLTQKALSKNPDAIIYSINSPGGSVIASRDIKRIIESVDVPTVCRYKDIATSGALWASMGCDKIVSDSLSLTGGVGATSSYLEFSGLMKKLGIEYVNLTSGKYKASGSPFKNATDKEKEIAKGKLSEVREVFIEIISENRNISKVELEKLDDGRTILGKKAEEIGLVDYLGGRKKVVEMLKERLNVEKLNINTVEEKGDGNIFSKLFTRIGYGIGSALKNTETNIIKSIKK